MTSNQSKNYRTAFSLTLIGLLWVIAALIASRSVEPGLAIAIAGGLWLFRETRLNQRHTSRHPHQTRSQASA